MNIDLVPKLHFPVSIDGAGRNHCGFSGVLNLEDRAQFGHHSVPSVACAMNWAVEGYDDLIEAANKVFLGDTLRPCFAS